MAKYNTYDFLIDSNSMEVSEDIDFSDIFSLLLELRYERNYKKREDILKFAGLVKGEY